MQLPLGNAALRLNIFSAVLGVWACGMVAAMGAWVAKRFVSNVEASACGVAAAMVFMSTPPVTHAATAAGPSMLTTLLALGALGLVVAAGERIDHSPLFLAASLLAGFAAGNHPSFGLVGILVGAGLLCFGNMDARAGLQAAKGALLFLMGALIPLVYALSNGETLRDFLSHALLQPYPNVFEGLPDAKYGIVLAQNVATLALLMAVPGFVLLLRSGVRRYGVFLGLALLFMGPLFPALTHHADAPWPVDGDAPVIIALAMVSLFAAWGMGVVGETLHASSTGGTRQRLVGVGVTAVLALAAVGAQRPEASNRRHGLAERLGRDVLASCPENALLISGDDGLTSLALALQHSNGYGKGILVLPAQALAGRFWAQTRARARLSAETGSLEMFPPLESVDAWAEEQPLLLARYLDERKHPSGPSPSRVDLALWELVKEHYGVRPLCFVGLSSPWLAARAQITGLVLSYPRRTAPAAPAPAAQVRCILSERHGSTRDVGIADTLAALVTPLSTAARMQGRDDQARELARLAIWLAPDAAGPRVAWCRAQARGGEWQEAVQEWDAYRAQAGRPLPESNIKRMFDRDYEAHEHAERFLGLAARETAAPSDLATRQDAATALWELDELVVLARGYEAIVKASPDDIDGLYQLAAARTQLGDLRNARDVLGQWIEALGLSPSLVKKQLDGDGRFALLRNYDPGSDAKHEAE